MAPGSIGRQRTLTAFLSLLAVSVCTLATPALAPAQEAQPEELWEQYPLEPRTDPRPSADRTNSAQPPVEASPAPAPGRASVDPADGGLSPVLIAALIAGALLLLGLVLLGVRSRSRPALASAGPARSRAPAGGRRARLRRPAVAAPAPPAPRPPRRPSAAAAENGAPPRATEPREEEEAPPPEPAPPERPADQEEPTTPVRRPGGSRGHHSPFAPPAPTKAAGGSGRAPLPRGAPRARRPERAVREASVSSTCKIVWQAADGESRFAAVVSGGDDEAKPIAESPSFPWTSASPPQATKASRAAHRALVARLAEEGWQPGGAGVLWYQQRLRHEQETPTHG